ncbi:MAG: hypothetical protein R3D25_07030 [Geminicoccaceae bacterium]
MAASLAAGEGRPVDAGHARRRRLGRPGGHSGWRGAAALGAALLAIALAALTLAGIGGLTWWPAVPLVGLVTVGVLAAFLARGHGRPFGLANGVTLLRLDLAACLLAAAWLGPAAVPIGRAWPGRSSPWRRSLWRSTGSTAGSPGDGRRPAPSARRFDMTSDTFFTIVLTLCTLRFTALGPGCCRSASCARPSWPPAWPGRARRPLPPSPRRRAACGTALLLLVLTLAPPLAPVASWLATGGLLILLLSFGRDIRGLLGRQLRIKPRGPRQNSSACVFAALKCACRAAWTGLLQDLCPILQQSWRADDHPPHPFAP